MKMVMKISTGAVAKSRNLVATRRTCASGERVSPSNFLRTQWRRTVIKGEQDDNLRYYSSHHRIVADFL
jgi:hypothetical protein